MLKIQNLLRTTDPEIFRSIGQIPLKIYFLKSENTLFKKMSFELSVAEMFL